MVELREIEEAAKQAPIKRAARKRIALRVIFAFAIVVVGIGLFFFLKALLFPSVPSPRKGIFFWESGREQSLFGRDTTLRVLLNQTFHRLNLKKDCSFSKEGVDRIKAGNKLIELIPENPEDIKINQWIKPDERDHLPTDEDGYRILENVQATIFTLEDNLAKGLQAVILIKKEDEEQWSCWAIEQEASGELDKSWIGEINKLLAQEQIEAPQTPEIFLITKVID
ncbi:hypothetical protein GTO10_04835, partial [Candidatus Saccharibacteria bacterium]|nr:hypothetical protein [Candidatus Saccharibacteria bacterium]